MILSLNGRHLFLTQDQGNVIQLDERFIRLRRISLVDESGVKRRFTTFLAYEGVSHEAALDGHFCSRHKRYGSQGISFHFTSGWLLCFV